MFDFPTEKPKAFPEFGDHGLPIGWCCGEAQKMLKEMIVELAPRTIFEIGSFKGMSAYFMAREAPEATIYCIDHWQGSAEHKTMGIDCFNLYETFIVNLWEYRDRIKPVKESSCFGLFLLSGYKIKPDFIYIDGSHDFINVFNDIFTSLILFPGQDICGDDYTLKDVRLAIAKIIEFNDVKLKLYNNRVWRLSWN